MRRAVLCLMLNLVVGTVIPAEPLAAVHRADLQPAVDRWLADQIDALLRLYRDRHAHPELSLQEEGSAAIIAEHLRAAGYQVTAGIGGHGLAAVLVNGQGATVMIRGDMDALPVSEETGLVYRSTVPGVMHACGHDIHMTNLVGTAQLLAALREQWRGTVLIVAQPAEEVGRGALAMIDDGLFERVVRPDYCLALHVAADLPTGTIGYTSGWATANVDSVDITIHGQGGHGSRPHEAVDPVVTGAQVVVALQTVVSRRVDPIEPAVITVGSFHAGSRHNIIPEEATLQLTVRSYGDETRLLLLHGIREITTNISQAMGCPRDPVIELREADFTPAGYNDPRLAAAAAAVMAEVLGAEQVVTLAPLTVGEDFSRYARHLQVPGLLFWLGAVNHQRYEEAMGGGPPLPGLHASSFAPDPQPTLETGIRCTSAIALSLLGREKNVDSHHRVHRPSLAGDGPDTVARARHS